MIYLLSKDEIYLILKMKFIKKSMVILTLIHLRKSYETVSII